MADAFIAVDAEWRVYRTNSRATTLIRRPASQCEGHLLWDCFPDLAGSSTEQELRAAARGSTTERRLEHFSATLYNWFDVWCVPADGGLYIFFRDVTDRARAMQSSAVRESLRQILEDAPVAISITRGPDHRYELVNRAARALVGGRSLEGLTARNALPEVDESLFAMLDRVFESGDPLMLRDLEVTYDRAGDGTLVTAMFDVTYQPLRDPDGSVAGIINTSVETTLFAHARRLAEEA